MTLTIGLAYAWEAVRGDARRWSPMQQLGRTSLFIYWIHVEMVYGLISLPLHKALSLGGAWTALGVFSIFMLGCSIAKDRVRGVVAGPPRRQRPAAALRVSSRAVSAVEVCPTRVTARENRSKHGAFRATPGWQRHC